MSVDLGEEDRRAAGGEIRDVVDGGLLELNLVVRGTASYLLGDRRYALTPGTLTWLFPGQDHVLVDESSDHELWLGFAWRAATARS